MAATHARDARKWVGASWEEVQEDDYARMYFSAFHIAGSL